jgi:predicted 3-demethylubiquinone-9 3-methyltransferase (glyoxalase superfamily)
MQKITPFLWYNTEAEEAANFYVSIFRNSRVLQTTRYTAVGPGPEGSVMTVDFELEGQQFVALNGGPDFKFTPAISFVVNCDTQQELDELWTKLSAGGEEVECGWLTDKYGVSWQIAPAILGDLLDSKNGPKNDAVMKALLKMKKLDIKKLQEAAQQV